MIKMRDLLKEISDNSDKETLLKFLSKMQIKTSERDDKIFLTNVSGGSSFTNSEFRHSDVYIGNGNRKYLGDQLYKIAQFLIKNRINQGNNGLFSKPGGDQIYIRLSEQE